MRLAVQLEYNKEEEPWYATYGTMFATLEVQRTIKRAELCASAIALASLIGPSTILTDEKGILDGSWRGEEKLNNTIG